MNSKEKRQEAIRLGTKAVTYQLAGQHHQAIDYFQQAMVIWREIGEANQEALTFASLGDIYKDTAMYEQAIECFQQALLMFREIVPSKEFEKQALFSLCQVYLLLAERGRDLQADEWNMVVNYLHELVELSRELGDRTTEGETLTTLGQINSMIGRWEPAVIFFEQARATGIKPKGDPTFLDKGIRAARDAYEIEATVKPHLDDAREKGDLQREALFLFYQGSQLYKLGTDDTRTRGIRYAEQALTIFEQVGDPLATKVRKELSRWSKEPLRKWWQFWR